MNYNPGKESAHPVEALKAICRQDIIHIRKGDLHSPTQGLIIGVSCQRI
jgi:hypothetical protein